MLIGRLTRDPDVRTFANGGKVVTFGFAVTNKKKNQSTGQWEDDPMFIDVKVFTRGENTRQADLVEQSLRKGHQVFLEGHLVFEQWDDKQSGQKRSKHVLVVDNFQFLEPRSDGGGGGTSTRYSQSGSSGMRRPAPAPAPASEYDGGPDMEPPLPPGGNESEIPF
jgi:single-strand DNA-binding protein